MSDFNMPPGVRASDIPGNGPGDVGDIPCEKCQGAGFVRDDKDPDLWSTCDECEGHGVIEQ